MEPYALTNRYRRPDAGTAMLASRSPDQPPIRLILVSDHQQLVVLVRDFDPAVPVPRSATPEDESGRGLLLVQSLSGQSGWYRPEDGTPGKVV